jgi:tripartite-type tricarboxylate transporter receptor subunit TctC
LQFRGLGIEYDWSDKNKDPYSAEALLNFSLQFVRSALGLGLVILAALCAPASAQTYPTRPVTLIHFGLPGGLQDQLGRLVAARMGERLGQTVVVDYKPGAGGNLAAEFVARSAADGYTLLLGTQGTQATNQFLYKQISFDPEKDFTAVHGLMSLPSILVVNATRPYKTVKELVDFAKRNPDKVFGASAGSGTGSHLALELFNSVAGVKITHVPYKGSAPAINDLIRGEVDLAFDYPVVTRAFLEAGKLRALATTGPKRMPSMADVPTIGEQGYPAAESTAWLGLFFPAKTPAAVVERWQAEIERIVQEPAYIEALGRMGGIPLELSGQKFSDFIDAERGKWKNIVLRSGAKVD